MTASLTRQLPLATNTPAPVPEERAMYTFFCGQQQCEIAHLFKTIGIYPDKKAIPKGMVELSGIMLNELQTFDGGPGYTTVQPVIAVALSDRMQDAWASFATGLYALDPTEKAPPLTDLRISISSDRDWYVMATPPGTGPRGPYKIGHVAAPALEQVLTHLKADVHPMQRNAQFPDWDAPRDETLYLLSVSGLNNHVVAGMRPLYQGVIWPPQLPMPVDHLTLEMKANLLDHETFVLRDPELKYLLPNDAQPRSNTFKVPLYTLSQIESGIKSGAISKSYDLINKDAFLARYHDRFSQTHQGPGEAPIPLSKDYADFIRRVSADLKLESEQQIRMIIEEGKAQGFMHMHHDLAKTFLENDPEMVPYQEPTLRELCEAKPEPRAQGLMMGHHYARSKTEIAIKQVAGTLAMVMERQPSIAKNILTITALLEHTGKVAASIGENVSRLYQVANPDNETVSTLSAALNGANKQKTEQVAAFTALVNEVSRLTPENAGDEGRRQANLTLFSALSQTNMDALKSWVPVMAATLDGHGHIDPSFDPQAPTSGIKNK